MRLVIIELAMWIVLLLLIKNCIIVPTQGHNNVFLNQTQLNDLFRGINLGNALESPNFEGEWGVYITEKYIQLITDAGFNLVRIPIRWSAHADSETPYSIEESFFNRIDWVVDQCLSRGLCTIINIHHYEEIMDYPELHKSRFLALWQQISVHYQNYSKNLYFEILNEPTNKLNSSFWNQYLQEAIEIIRVANPKRTIIIGPTNWNNISDLDNLFLPQNDHQILVTFHYYSPFQFTHQGAAWVTDSYKWLGTEWIGTTSEKDAIRQDFDTAVQWAKNNNKSLFLGEFGAYSKADMESRARWTTFVAREAEERNISWAYWEFCSGFGVYDPLQRQWRPKLLQALLPDSPLLSSMTFPSTNTIHSKTSNKTSTQTTGSINLFASLFAAIAASFFYRKRYNKT
ncbi:MAG: glycoside hydrolase family 5 protein [Candidatus Hodarchaeota archaeon]